jgi:hypothetical protein
VGGPFLAVLAPWAVGGLYLALGGSLVRELLPDPVGAHLLAGLVLVSVQGVGGVAQLVCTRLTNTVSGLVGGAALLVGLATVACALPHGAGRGTGSPVLFLVGDAVTGVGFGLTFLSATRRVGALAPPERRGGVLAAFFVVGYLGISVPVVAVGVISGRLGLVPTFRLFALVVAVAVIASVVPLLRSARCWPSPRRTGATGSDAG